MPAVTQKCDSMYKSINVITVKIAKLKLTFCGALFPSRLQ